MLSPNLHRVCPDQYRGIRIVLRKLRHCGYMRPGLVLNGKSDVRTLQLWSSGFYGSEFSSKRSGIFVPVLDCDEVNEKELMQWYRRYKPDVIISSDLEIVKPLQDAGLSFPNDVGLAALHLRENQNGIAGIDQNEKLIGAAAIEQALQLMKFNQRGIPEHPRVLQIPSTWRGGESIRTQIQS